MKMTNI